jgi:hypothetical protein
MAKREIKPRETVDTEHMEVDADVEIGQWYWVKGWKHVYNRADGSSTSYNATEDQYNAWVNDEEEEEAEAEDLDELLDELGKKERDIKEAWASDEYDEDDEEEEDEDAEEEEEEEEEYIEYEWFACIIVIGSNFVKLESPSGSNQRVHFEDFYRILRREHDPQPVIDKNVRRHQTDVQEKMERVKEITANLGFSSRLGIEQKDDSSSRALSTLSSTDDMDSYKNALVAAKDDQLPALFSEIKESNKRLATWLKAQAVPLKATALGMQDVVDDIEGRIFDISIYAGLSEDVYPVQDGEPAPLGEKLRIMQRKLYMDEECVANYRIGGLEFKTIHEFDEWLCEPENLNRVFPFPRCMVAFQVRRNEKEREWGGDPEKLLVNMQLAKSDTWTWMYVRNGEKLYCLGVELEFGEKIFPDKDGFNPMTPMVFSTKWGGRDIEDMMTVHDYEIRCAEQEEARRLYKAWRKKYPKKHEFANPYRDAVNRSFRPNDWEPFTSESVYFDEAMKAIEDRVRHYNRIALIVQGLFDRSDILHPHAPVKLWNAQGFGEAVELIYDASFVLYEGPEPNFEAYHQECNASLGPKSIVIGQDEAWQRREAARENARLDASWRDTGRYRHTFFTPYGDKGPGYLSRMSRWMPRARKANFRWTRKRQHVARWSGHSYDDEIQCTIAVPADSLFNVSAYKEGDFRQFYKDPRTRARYLKWAPMLLTAEEFLAGNIKPQKPKEA